MAQQSTIGKHATTVATDKDDVTRVTYHSTVVVEHRPDGTVRLDSGGWPSATTKTRMNQAAMQLGLSFHVRQSKGTWYVDTRHSTLEFTDGMVIDLRKGELVTV